MNRTIELKEDEVKLILDHLQISHAAYNHPAKTLIARLKKWHDGFEKKIPFGEKKPHQRLRVHKPDYMVGHFGLLKLTSNKVGDFQFMRVPDYKPGPNYVSQKQLDQIPITADGILELSFKYDPLMKLAIQKWRTKCLEYIAYKKGKEVMFDSFVV